MSTQVEKPKEQEEKNKILVSHDEGDTLLWFNAFDAVEKKELLVEQLMVLQQYNKFRKSHPPKQTMFPITILIPPDNGNTRWIVSVKNATSVTFFPPIPLHFSKEGKMKLFNLSEDVQWLCFCTLSISQLCAF